MSYQQSLASRPMPGRWGSFQSDPVDENRLNYLKLTEVAHTLLPKVLAFIFYSGSSMERGETVADYMHRIMSTKGTHSYRKVFNRSQVMKMSETTDVASYDVSSLYPIIIYGCKGLADRNDPAWITENENSLEWMITAIKNQRNSMIHETSGITGTELWERTEHLKSLLERALQLAGSLYQVDQAEIEWQVRSMKDHVDQIREQPLTLDQMRRSYKLSFLYAYIDSVLKDEGIKELQPRCIEESKINAFIFGEDDELWLNIESIFMRIMTDKTGQKIPYEQIINFCRNNALPPLADSSKAKPEIFLIEGQGGVGKTTLLKLIKYQWATGGKRIKGLADFDLLLFTDCNNKKIKCFSNLLHHLFSKTIKNHDFEISDFRKRALNLKILLLIDSLDELNSSSKCLFKDVLELQKHNDIVVLCTSRPEKVKYFYDRVPNDFRKVHVRLLGVPENCKEDFLRKYHDKLKEKGKSTQDTEVLVNYLRNSPSSLQEAFKVPYNLVGLASLWARHHTQVASITASAKLNSVFFESMPKMKILQTIRCHEHLLSSTDEELTQKINGFLPTLFLESLVCLRWNSIADILPTSLQTLKSACNANHLPPETTLPAFFIMKMIDNKEHASFPIKIPQDFYAAKALTSKLTNRSTEEEKQQILQQLIELMGSNHISIEIFSQVHRHSSQGPSTLRDILLELHSDNPESLDMSMYQSIIIHLAGLLSALEDPEVLESKGEEIVTLLRESGVGFNTGNVPYVDDDYDEKSECDNASDDFYDDSFVNDGDDNVDAYSQTDGIPPNDDEHASGDDDAHDCIHDDEDDIEYYDDDRNYDAIYGDDDDWYQVIEKTNNNSRIINQIQTHIKGRLTVTKGRVDASIKLLQNAKPRRIVVDIQDDPANIPKFQDLLRTIARCTWVVQLFLHHDFRHSSESVVYEDTLQLVLQRCTVTSVMAGRLSDQTLALLPATVRSLYLAVTTDHQATTMLPKINQLKSQMRDFKILGLHVGKGVSPQAVTPVSSVLTVKLLLSDLEENSISRAWETIKQLKPERLCSLRLPRAHLGYEGCKRLLEGLFNEGIVIDELRVPDTLQLTENEERILQVYAWKKLKCRFRRRTDDAIWDWRYI